MATATATTKATATATATATAFEAGPSVRFGMTGTFVMDGNFGGVRFVVL
jgi:hypothetical protein